MVYCLDNKQLISSGPLAPFIGWSAVTVVLCFSSPTRRYGQELQPCRQLFWWSRYHSVASDEVLGWSTDHWLDHRQSVFLSKLHEQGLWGETLLPKGDWMGQDCRLFYRLAMSHTKRRTKDNRKNLECHVVVTIRRMRTDKKNHYWLHSFLSKLCFIRIIFIY